MAESASTSRRIFFKSRGGTYSAIFMAETGDLWQEYSGSAQSPTNYYPNFETSPVTLALTVTSSRTTGIVSPTSIEYIVAGTTLTFTGTACTTSGFENIFRLTSNGMLQIFGNLVKIASGSSFIIQAKVTVGDDPIVASLPVTISPYTDTDTLKVTIAPGEAGTTADPLKNFTINEKGGSCKLKAMVYRRGTPITSGLSYRWYKLGSSGWGESISTQQTIEVKEEDVDTYAQFKVDVYESATISSGMEPDGSDTQGVMDASDPYDIDVSIKLFTGASLGGAKTGLANTDETLNDDMLDDDYLEYTARLVKRDGNRTQVSGATWQTGYVVTAAGLPVITISPTTPSSGIYKITVEMLKATGYGEFEFIFGATK